MLGSHRPGTPNEVGVRPDRSTVRAENCARPPAASQQAGHLSEERPGQPGGTDSVGAIRADPQSAEFFSGAARGELMIKYCDECGTWLAPTAGACPNCGGGEPRWVAASGRGRLVSWAGVHPPSSDGPLALPALVALAEGP